MRKLLRREEGSSLVEMAFAMLVMLPILFGTIEFSLVYYTYHNVTDAARVAARWASVRGADSCTNIPSLSKCKATSDDVKAYVRGLGYPGMVASNINVTTTWSSVNTESPSSTLPATWTACASGCNSRYDQVKVQVSYDYPIYVIYWKSATFTLTSSSAMVITE